MARPNHVPLDYSILKWTTEPAPKPATEPSPKPAPKPAPKPPLDSASNTQPDKKEDTVFIYIDNSNLWLQGQRTYAEKKRLKTPWDPTWRFDAGKLKGILLGGNSGLTAEEKTFRPEIKLYGSTPPPVDTVWAALKSHNIKVSTHARSSWNGREKEVDNDLIAESVDDAGNAYHLNTQAVFIIVSGDRDLRPAIIRITAKGFRVHLWSWRNGLAKVFKEPDDKIESSLFTVHHLDPYLEQVGSKRTTFNPDRAAIHPHSIVVLDPRPRGEDIENFIENLTTPVYRYDIPTKRPDSSSKDLVIVPSGAHLMKYDDLESLLTETREKLKGLDVLPYLIYREKYPPPKGKEGMLAKSKRWGEGGRFFSEAFCKDPEVDDDDNEEEREEQEKIQRERKERERKEQEKQERERKDQQRREQEREEEERIKQEREEEDRKEHEGNEVQGNWRANDQANWRASNNANWRANDNANWRVNDNANGGFTTELRLTQKRNHQLTKAENSIQRHCWWREYCPEGSKCRYGHTKEERQDFKTYGVRLTPKYRYCNRDDCRRGEKCSFAHDKTELFCPTCKQEGDHEFYQCPERKKNR